MGIWNNENYKYTHSESKRTFADTWTMLGIDGTRKQDYKSTMNLQSLTLWGIDKLDVTTLING